MWHLAWSCWVFNSTKILSESCDFSSDLVGYLMQCFNKDLVWVMWHLAWSCWVFKILSESCDFSSDLNAVFQQRSCVSHVTSCIGGLLRSYMIHIVKILHQICQESDWESCKIPIKDLSWIRFQILTRSHLGIL